MLQPITIAIPNKLTVILFDAHGKVTKVLVVPVEVAKQCATENKHQRGWVITTNQDFLNNLKSKNITDLVNLVIPAKAGIYDGANGFPPTRE